AAFFDRLPTELPHFHQDIEDTSGFVVRRGAVVVEFVDELFVLGANAPIGRRLLPGLHRLDELVAPLDAMLVALAGRSRAHRRAVRTGSTTAPAVFVSNRYLSGSGPVARRGHPQGGGGDRRGFTAQDARTERDGARGGVRTDRLAL